MIVLILLASLTCILGQSTFIIGGNDAQQIYPYIASIKFDTMHICGGVILNEKFILTAAHCVHDADEVFLTVDVGTIYRNGIGQRLKVMQKIIHPSYNDLLVNNDVALLKVLGKIAFSNKVQAIKLHANYTSGFVNLSVLGWGLTNNVDNNLANRLQVLRTTSMRNSLCRIYHRELHFGHLCTWPRQNRGFCTGDSGGPLVYNNELVGLVSWVPGECGGKYPDVYVRISQYIDWIKLMSK